MKRLIPVLVCLTLGAAGPAHAVDTVVSRDAPDLSAARGRIAAGDYRGAVAILTPLTETHQHADVYNLLGYSLRKSGDARQALVYYRKALDFDPAHRGALEYLGELYVETGQLDKARVQVAALRKACPQGCEELADLERTVAGAAAARP